MNLLAIETSSEVGTVALHSGEELVQRRIETPRDQTQQVLPIVDELLAGAGLVLTDLEAIAFGRGPGSFTGLRIATAIAQGLGLAANLRLLPVSSLAAIAQGVWRSHSQKRSLVCIDARMGEVFWGAFEIRGDLAELIGEEHLSVPELVEYPDASDWGPVGSGFAVDPKELADAVKSASGVLVDRNPEAVDLLPLARSRLAGGEFVSPLVASPIYLREQSAWSK